MCRRAMPAKWTICGYQPKGISKLALFAISACVSPTLPRRSLPQASPRTQSTTEASPASIASAARSGAATTAVAPLKLAALKNCPVTPSVRARRARRRESEGGERLRRAPRVGGFPDPDDRRPPRPSHRSDHLRGAQRGDLAVVEPVLAQHRGRVLADRGREPGDADCVRGQLDRRAQDADAAAHRILPLDDQP